MLWNTDYGGKLQSSGRLMNVGCPDCGGQLLKLVSYSTKGSGRIYHKGNVFYQYEKFSLVPSYLIEILLIFYQPFS